MNDDAFRETLRLGAAEFGITLDEGQIDLFDAFTSRLLEWNKRLNLTRIVDPLDVARRHFLDSLSLLSVLEVAEGSAVIDIGTGAGLPGIALKIARPDLHVTLLDSVRKRLSFLDSIVGEFGLNGVDLVHARAEDAGKDRKHRERYELVVSRAVARLNVLTELCMPFCKVRGDFAAYKGPDVGEEIHEASTAIAVLGGRLRKAHRLALAHGGRTLVVIQKTGRTPAAYPRKAGIPERNPL